MRFLTLSFPRLAAAALFLSVCQLPIVSAQTSTFLGGSGSTISSREGWTTSDNWSPTGIPEGSTVWAEIGPNGTTTPGEGNRLRIFYPSSEFTDFTLNVGAISFLNTLTSPELTYEVQNNANTSTPGRKGFVQFYGVDTTIGGQQRTVILEQNSTLVDDVAFTQALSGQEFVLSTSGAISVVEGASLTLTTKITEDASPRAITKIGPGMLSFANVRSLGNESSASTYSGGFTLEEGTVQYAISGSSSASPFGIGPLTLKGGTLRSTTTSGRTINVSINLDGGATIGSTETGFTGNITVNSASGSLTTTLLSDSVVTIADGATTIWNQAISGTGNLTKAGGGLLNLNGFGGDLTYTGNTIAAEGTLVIDGDYTGSGTFEVQSGATLTGTGSIAGATTILAGGTLAPGASPGVLSFGGDLSLAGTTVMEINGPARGTDYDGIDVAGTLTYGGTLDLQIPSTLADGTYQLFDGFASQSGSFASITLAGAYSGSLAESAGVWTGSFQGQNFTFTSGTGDLVVVPEPAALAAALTGLAVAAGMRRWRRAGLKR
jgi:hypothetical protein